jgi:peptide-methionine (S)-S-oxide reductase
MGDHTEAMQVDFDPQQIGYEDVATLFWKTHNPCATPYSRQYMSAIWYHDGQQQEFVQSLLTAANERFDGAVTTPVEPLQVFYLAEDYHQKYRLQSKRGLMSVFQTMYPTFNDFNNSTAATRLNAFAAGNGTRRLFEEEVNQYGFPREELESVLRI